MGDQAWFRAADATHGYELWKSDGTEANTTLVADIQPGSASGIPVFGPAGFAAVGSRLDFFADDGVHGLEPWSSDGTTTAMLADLNAAGSSPDPAPSDQRRPPPSSSAGSGTSAPWTPRATRRSTSATARRPAPASSRRSTTASAFDLSYLGVDVIVDVTGYFQ